MTENLSHSWSQPAHHDAAASKPAEDDFDTFLDLDDFHLNYSSYEPQVPDEEEFRQHVENAMDTSLDSLDDMQPMQDYRAAAPHAPLSNMVTLQTQNLQHQHHQHHFLNDPRMHGQQVIPPTPNSVDLPGAAAAHYYQQLDQQSRAMIEHYQRRKEEGFVFTPLVSPAVTPLDVSFQVSEYTIPGAYFSPLTSPAIEAQNHSTNRMFYNPASISDTSVPPSPIDMNIDPNLTTTSSYPSPARKTRRKLSTSSRSTARAVRQSPAMKPQKRKGTSTSSVNSKEVTELEDGNRKSRMQQEFAHPAILPVPYYQDASDAESISPEPLLTDMAPPPLPKSNPNSQSSHPASSPAPSKTREANSAINANLSPATPASLMRLQQQGISNGGLSHSPQPHEQQSTPEGLEPVLEDIMLPDAASSAKPSLPPIETSRAEGQTTPTLSGKNTAKAVNSKVMPISSDPGSAKITHSGPTVNGLNSPSESSSSKKGEPKAGGRGTKKRPGNTSVQVSPALRPRISPSIKPLLPEGSVSAETSALLLASKSNYQNILEGTHLPGVSYPEALSTNLSSKRTSHKIAEQGRRNRINTALQEIASLLPSTPNGNSSSGNGSGSDPAGINSGSAAQQSNSKASTVELAIDYIKALRAELAETKGKLEMVEKRLEDK